MGDYQCPLDRSRLIQESVYMKFAKLSQAWLITLLFSAVLLSAACGPSQQPAGAEQPAQFKASAAPAAEEDAATSGAASLLLGSPTLSELAPTSEEPAAADEAKAAEPERGAEREFDANGVEVGFTSEGRPYRGSLDAPVVMQEFSDYQCPYCARYAQQTQPGLDEKYVASGEMLVVFYDFPLTSIHAQAVDAAEAARCAGAQSAAAYWGMHDLLFANPGEWGNAGALSVFNGYAEELGLDVTAFTQCQESGEFEALVEADVALGRSLGVGSTPSFFLNDQPFVGAQPYDVFDKVIAAIGRGEQVAQQNPRQEAPTQPAAKPTPAAIAGDDIAAALGDPAAPVTIVEFSDYQCPYCQRHSAQTLPGIIANMIETGRVRYVFKDFPLDSIHPEARDAAAAARCAGEQDSYWQMHDAIFEWQQLWASQGDSAPGIFAGMAEDLGLDGAAFQSCQASGRYDQVIQDNVDEGISLGVRGTPFFFIDGYPINGAQPYDLFEYAIGLAEEGTLGDAYQQPDQAQQQEQPPAAPEGPVDVPIADSPYMGDADAPVVIVEYTDLQCPFCSRHFLETMPQIKQNFIDTGLVRYVFKDFPLTNIHPQAVPAAEAARCANDQNAYVAMHDQLFAAQELWANNSEALAIFSGIAEQLGLDMAAYEECMAENRHQAQVLADLEEGASLGVRGTPAFFINGYFLSGAQPYSTFESAINSLLADG